MKNEKSKAGWFNLTQILTMLGAAIAALFAKNYARNSLPEAFKKPVTEVIFTVLGITAASAMSAKKKRLYQALNAAALVVGASSLSDLANRIGLNLTAKQQEKLDAGGEANPVTTHFAKGLMSSGGLAGLGNPARNAISVNFRNRYLTDKPSNAVRFGATA